MRDILSRNYAMLNYSLVTFKSHLASHAVVSLSKTVVYDIDSPIRALYHFISESKLVFLESISENIKHNRYSYLAFDPYEHIACTDTLIRVTHGETIQTFSENLYTFLNKKLTFLKNCPPDTIPHSCGVLGNISYECFKFLEDIPVVQKRALNTPDAEFIIPRTMLIFDNFFHKVTIIRNVFQADCHQAESAYTEAELYIQTIQNKLYSELAEHPAPLGDPVPNYDDIPATSSVEKDLFLKRVAQCQEYIKAGDIFQIQVSRRCSIPIDAHPIMLYRYLRNYNPSPFMFYVQFDQNTYVGASPELLVNVDGRTMCIRPIAGTRKRYSKEKNEQEIMHELQHDEKEMAEHIMLVDLARNDIGRACKIGTVSVSELMVIERYAHVLHMVSDVVGELLDDKDAVDAFKFGFPAGTVAGAPKIRAMEIISEMEDMQREFYSGGVVFFDTLGNLKSALSIRTLMVQDGIAYTQAAAGIVADSIPEMEYKETENKMRACLSAMHQFRRTV